MTEKYQYELEMTKSLEVLLFSDLHTQLAEAVRRTKQGVANPVICLSCEQKITTEPMFVFRCVQYISYTYQFL